MQVLPVPDGVIERPVDERAPAGPATERPVGERPVGERPAGEAAVPELPADGPPAGGAQGTPRGALCFGDPRQPTPLDAVASPLAQLMLARARRRAVMPLDTVSFVASCPACGRDCEWTQTRQETRVRSTVDCRCTG